MENSEIGKVTITMSEDNYLAYSLSKALGNIKELENGGLEAKIDIENLTEDQINFINQYLNKQLKQTNK